VTDPPDHFLIAFAGCRLLCLYSFEMFENRVFGVGGHRLSPQ
jgi:hypothetical protein